jgi:hypothetical protein
MMKKVLFILAISMLLLIPTVHARDISAPVNSSGVIIPGLFFDSELQITYDADAVNQLIFTPDGPPVPIPIYIKYRVDMPTPILTNSFLRILFMHTLIISSAQVFLSVLNPPEWASISITPSISYIRIDTAAQQTVAILYIACHSDAPSAPYTLRIKGEVSVIYTIDDSEAYLDLTFMPQYIPLINLVTNPSPQTPPNQPTFIPISISNLGNDFTKITAKILNINDLNGWTVYITPETYLPFHSSQPVNTTFLCIPPPDFEGNQTIDLQFTPSRWSNPEETGASILLLITAHYP